MLARLVVVTPPNFQLYYRADNMQDTVFSKTALEDGRVVHTWELREPRSIRPERAMPPRNRVRPELHFGKDQNRWTDVARGIRSAFSTSRATWLVRQTAKDILSSVDKPDNARLSDLDKARALYTWVNETIKTESAGENPHTTIREKSGSRQSLFIALLDACDIDYSIAVVANDPYMNDREPRYLDEEGIFRQGFVVVEDGSERVFIDTE